MSSRDRGGLGMSATGGTAQQSQPDSRRESKARRGPEVPRIPEVRRNVKSELPLPEPLGEDAPMTERLERILTGRKPLPPVEENAMSTAGGAFPQDSSNRGLRQGQTK